MSPYYLYALTWADCPQEGFGPGVDPRFPAESSVTADWPPWPAGSNGMIAIWQSSRKNSADLAWVSKVAVRHHEIIGTLAGRWLVFHLTMRGALGHRIKGEGGSFGFDAMSEIGAALEQAGKKAMARRPANLSPILANTLKKSTSSKVRRARKNSLKSLSACDYCVRRNKIQNRLARRYQQVSGCDRNRRVRSRTPR